MLTKLLCLGVLALVAMAQDIPSGVKYDLTGMTYPRVAHLARVQGVVKLELIPNETGQDITVNQWKLAYWSRQASDNLAKWRTNQPVTVNYIFKLADPGNRES